MFKQCLFLGRYLDVGSVAIAGVLLSGCSVPEVSTRSERAAGAASESDLSLASRALADLNLDSICYAPCPVVMVDSIVREAESVETYLYTAPEIGRLSQTSFEGGWAGHTIRMISPWLRHDPLTDTAQVAAFVVHKNQDTLRQINIPILSPGGFLQVWKTTFHQAGEEWRIISTEPHYQP